MGHRNSALYTLKGPEAEKQLGMPEGGEIVHMRLMRIGDSAMLELFQVDKVEQGASQTIADYGLTHIGVCVDDIDAAAEQFREAGGRLLAPIRGLTGVEGGKGNEGVYGRAPWGMLVELLTYPSGIKQSANAATTRWTPPAN